MDPAAWFILYSVGTPPHPAANAAGGWTFDVPPAPGSVHYVTTPTSGYANAQIGAQVVVEASVDAVFDFHTAPDNTCEGAPSSARLFLQRRGDDMSGTPGTTEFYRWWNVNGLPLRAGSDTMLGSLTNPAEWSSVLGRRGDSSPEATAAFNAAIADLGAVGLTFGGGCFYGHGVRMTQGNARFDVTGFTLQ